MKIPFVGSAYAARSLNADAQRALNCYLELDNASPRAPLALYGTPGLVLEYTLATAPVRGAVLQGDYVYFVSGDTVYRADAAGVIATLGMIATAAGQIGIASNGTQVMVVDGTSGWIVDGTTVAQIVDADFPAGVTRVTCQDGFFIVTGLAGSQQFWINENPNDGSGWDGTDFASAEGAPDNTITCISNHRELWLFGAFSAEVWVNTGNVDFPFERSGNVFLEVGTAAAGSVAPMDNTLFWLGRSVDSAGVVYKANGYSPQRISTHAIEREIQSYPRIDDAVALTYEQEGHHFYVLSFPTANRTWVYDASTEQWHERAWRDPSTGQLNRWRAQCAVYFRSKRFVGDFETGKIYSLNLDTYTDNGDPILRLRTTQCMDSPDGARNFYASLQVDMEAGVGLATGQGSDPQLMLRYSNDGGHRWSGLKTKSIGAVGQYDARVKFGPTGAGRNRVWEISMTDPVKFAVLGAYARVTPGSA